MSSNPSFPVLTVIVPTFNRADCLALLLRTLREECVGLESAVQVLVSDNASTDRTPEVTAAAQVSCPELKVQRHPRNTGPDENFCSAIDRVETRWFWIIGDDDCPKRGVLARVVALLRERAPALLYMQSEWLNPVTGPDQGEPVGALHVEALDAAGFARRVHVWLTFISGVVVDRSRLGPDFRGAAPRRFTGTSLVQLGWALPALAGPGPFLFVHERCMLATKDNTGGYPLLTVFGAGFARIADETFGPGSRLARILIGRTIVNYLPGLLWGARHAPSGRHAAEDPWPAMRAQLGGRAMFWLLLVPLGRFPHWLAQPVYQAWRVFHRLSRDLLKLRLRALARQEARP
ncbi:MAG TPA: glycosyltransferase family 2 protein [Burkholderiaceae bacterium]|nr:glycosyltransferase family 2 protein [Burkholderiaceae bacterium]